MESHKIARLVVEGDPSETKLKNLIAKFISKAKNRHFEFVITPGGFLSFDFPEGLDDDIDIDNINEKQLQLLQKEAEEVIFSFFGRLKDDDFQKLKKIADYFTIGIDGSNESGSRHIELIAVYNLKKEKVIRWTGKFYPTEYQKRSLIKFNDLDSHFIELNSQKIMILGCHDLNVFSPRGQAMVKPSSYKSQVSERFRSKCEMFKPEIILQHPHTTDSPNIWNQPWRKVEKELSSVKHFASGIKYYNGDEEPRGLLDDVLEKTKKGDVVDYY